MCAAEQTQLIYLQDTYAFEGPAKILRVYPCERAPRYACVLDRTFFHPQGGGNLVTLAVCIAIVEDLRSRRFFLILVDRWCIRASLSRVFFELGETVYIKIDRDRRTLNARLHSAGHLVDVAARKVASNLIAIKGYHFPDNPFVEFSGIVDKSDTFKRSVQDAVRALVTENTKVYIKTTPSTDRVLRYVRFGTYPACGCGGTHVASSGEIGAVVINKVRTKKGNTKIFYTLEDT